MHTRIKALLRQSALGLGLIVAATSYSASAADKITVFAAASLTNALEDISTLYQKEHPVKIQSSFASSSTLARQLEQGAPADLFISADQQWMDYAVEKKTVDTATRITLLGNDLVLIAPADEKITPVADSKKADWKSLLSVSHIAVGDPDHVPAGIYAKESLQNMGLWPDVEAKLARASNVRAALALVERGEAKRGIVYGSDAKATQKVAVIATFPAESHKPVEYPMAIVADKMTPDVSAFYQYLQGPEATAIFEKYGFSPRK